MRQVLSLLLFAALGLEVLAQNTIAFQGFEGTGGCPDWAWTGGQVNTQLAETGTSSNRVGNLGGGTTIMMAPVDVTGYANVQLSVSHASSCGSGPGLDWGSDTGREGAAIEVRYNGGAWVVMGRMTGGGDYCHFWGSQGGNTGAGCAYTMPNPLLVNVPAGTTSVEVRMYSTNNASCASSAPNFFTRADEGFYVDNVRLTTSSPVVTPATGNVTWTGTQSTDWFDCRNWNPTVVPGPGWNVTIDQTAAQHCVVGNSAVVPMAATCNSLLLRTNGPHRRLTIGNGRSLTVGTSATILRTAATTDSLILHVQNGSFQTGSLMVTGIGATFRNNSAANTATILGDLDLISNGRVNVNNSTLSVGGDINNNNPSASLFLRTNAWVVLNGTGPQTIGTSGFTDTYPRLRVQKAGGDVTLLDPVDIPNAGTLQLIQGRLFTDGTNILTMKPGSAVTGASDLSFVHGPMRKQGNTAFDFPVGEGNVHRPIGLVGTFGANLPTNQYTAQYFHTDPHVAVGAASVPALDHFSDCEYWTLVRSGTLITTPIVELSWSDPTSCGVDLPIALRVAHWDGSAWQDRGNGDFIDNGGSGTLITSANQSAFGAFTLASSSTMNPLPIELLTFDAQPRAQVVELTWTTLSERDNAAFRVERSGDNSTFTPVLEVPGQGTTTQRTDYAQVDPAPLPGRSYYRLRQIDTDGTSTLSHTVPVYFGSAPSLSILTADAYVSVRHGPEAGTYTLFDAQGRLIASGAAPANAFDIPTGHLARGVHLLRLSVAGQEDCLRFVP
jgi:hypothetical protein